VLVAKAGNVIYQKAFGYRNYDTKEPLDNNSVFELASVSKQFTAMGILLLKDKNKLKLSDSLRKFFPELPYTNITIQHLLTHTSGLPDYMEAMSSKWNHKKIAFNKDVINFLVTEKLPANFSPGQRWEYSNTAYQMLASIIEKVSGLSYREYMQKMIFNPLGMTQTRVYNTRRSTEEIIPNYAYGYVYSDSLKRYMLPDSLPALDFVIYLDGIQGDGIVNSTTGDLLKWDRALKNHTLLKETTQKEMLSPYSMMDTASEKYYGYGVILGSNEIGSYIMHDGGWPGYYTMLARYLADDLTITVLSNNESNSPRLAGALAYIMTNRPVVAPYVHSPALIDTAILDRYVGKYKIPGVPIGSEIELVKQNGKLFIHSDKFKTDTELTPESSTKFYNNKGADQQIEFEMDTAGKVVKAFFINYGMKKQIQKVN
jgi:CubicO group peptidase (beta-lactamase class C family)